MLVKYYLNKLGLANMPEFLKKYLLCPSILRLKKIGYFCGMDYASKDIYNFSEYISRYDHSLSVALLTYKLTQDKKSTLAGLFHDIATPCFSHVIDYMNEDYEKQESTEKFTESILRRDEKLMKCLDEDGINVEDVINFKNYFVVDNERPKLCADRIDGIILTGIGWTKNITKEDIDKIIDDLVLYTNEEDQTEIGFKSKTVANKVMKVSESIDTYCHSSEDNYMMQLLAEITKLAIDTKVILYDDLYKLNEDTIFSVLKKSNNNKLKTLINEFETKKSEEIPVVVIPNLKVRHLNPLVAGKRYK